MPKNYRRTSSVKRRNSLERIQEGREKEKEENEKEKREEMEEEKEKEKEKEEEKETEEEEEDHHIHKHHHHSRHKHHKTIFDPEPDSELESSPVQEPDSDTEPEPETDPFVDHFDSSSTPSSTPASTKKHTRKHHTTKTKSRMNMKSFLSKSKNADALINETKEAADHLDVATKAATKLAEGSAINTPARKAADVKKSKRGSGEPSYFNNNMPTPASEIHRAKSNDKLTSIFDTPKVSKPKKGGGVPILPNSNLNEKLAANLQKSHAARSAAAAAAANAKRKMEGKNTKGRSSTSPVPPTATSPTRSTTPTPPQTQTQPQPPAAPPSPSELPSGWEEVKTENGQSYFYHRITRTTRWVKPTGEIAEAMESRIQDEERQKQAKIYERKKELDLKMEAGAKEAEEGAKFNKKIELKMKDWICGKNIWQMLNELNKIWPDAPTPMKRLDKNTSSESELKKAYVKAIRVVHPDKNAGGSLEVRSLSKAVFTVISTFYEKARG